MKSPKVFGVGLQKTGTTSLGKALQLLGYTVVESEIDREPLYRGDMQALFACFDTYDAAEDNPWSILYKELHQKFPDAKFILTIRDEEKWIRSMVNHFGTSTTKLREFIYGQGKGSPIGNEQLYVQRFQKHNQDVVEYFERFPGQLLVIDITKQARWDEICAHIGLPIPNVPFPFLNKRQWSLWDRLLGRLGLLRVDS